MWNSGMLSIKFLCATLPYMSISAGIIIAVTFHEVDCSPNAKTCTKCYNECLKYAYCALKNAIIKILRKNK